MYTALIDGIIDGSITIDSPEAFSSILEHFPDNPDLLYMYAVLLEKNNKKTGAIEFYERATKFCTDSGKTVQAIIYKAHKWRLSRPAMEEIDSFFSNIKNTKHNRHPFSDFFNYLFRPEKFHLMLNFEHIFSPKDNH